MILNVEIKAKAISHSFAKNYLDSNNAKFIGVDHQIDTYYKVANGRLKLREGTIESNLIHYVRGNQAGPKQSDILLYKSNPSSNLKQILAKANGILCRVDKYRRIYFIDNVKFHLDEVENLGTFIEIEAIDETGEKGIDKLQEQCNFYIDALKIKATDLIEVSYSDFFLQK